MSVDRSWIERRINPDDASVTQEFKDGVKEFLEFAYNHPQSVTNGTIKCPCDKCDLSMFQGRETVTSHLHKWGFRSFYTRWYAHGESVKLETHEHHVSNDQQLKKKESSIRNSHVFRKGFARCSKVFGVGLRKRSARPCQSIHKDSDRYYEAALSYRAKIHIATDILDRLTKNQVALFRTTCFGSWLDVQHTCGDPLLTHLILQTEVFHDPPTPDEMWFNIGGQEIRFSREEFCLVTGFQFGSDFHILPWVAGMSGNPFRDRLFPNIPSSQSLKLSDIVRIFDDMHSGIPMDDHDAVRICLLMLLEMGFLGHQPTQVVRNELFMLVEDLDSWNLFPWGSYIWQFTYPQLSKAIAKRHDSHVAYRSLGKEIKYTLTGFIWAFKIWIFEAFPIARSYTEQDVGLIPRAISWRREKRRNFSFTWEGCLNFLIVDDERRPPLRTLKPTDAEMKTDWWTASVKYFGGVDDQRQRPVKNKKKVRSPSPVRPTKKARCPSPSPLAQIRDIPSPDHAPSTFDGVDGCMMPTCDAATTPLYREDCHTRGRQSTSYDGVDHTTMPRSDIAPTYQQLVQCVTTSEDTVRQLVHRVTTLEGRSHVDGDTLLEGAIPLMDQKSLSMANCRARREMQLPPNMRSLYIPSTPDFRRRPPEQTIPIPSTVMPLRSAEFKASSGGRDHQIGDRVNSTSRRVDTSSRPTSVPTPLDERVATLDERVAALEANQCTILDMVTRLPVFSKTVQLLSDHVEDAEPVNRPPQIKTIENGHKRQKGKSERCNSNVEKVAANQCENIKEKHVSEYEIFDDAGQPSDVPFDPRTWVEVICNPKKNAVDGAGPSQEAEKILNQTNSSSSTKGPHCNTSTPDDNETNIESVINARVEAQVKARFEVARLEMKVQMEKQFKQMSDSLKLQDLR